MKKILLLLTLILLFTSPSAHATDPVEGPKRCEQCGMDRTTFAQSRMLILYADGSTVGVCSLHCAAVELQESKEKPLSSLMVADYTTKELIDARKATWVVGGKKKGVMTAQAKWAFAKPEEAKRFMEENGGTLNTFDQALHAATMEVLEMAAEEQAVEKEMHHERQ
ncbi:MAG TPA: nitrous oxide reductase accessory protein NosL [Geobacterales bacterium]|nr:nitrous oxide reductase accessory protein NosL [Geobacterales bacterium]